MSDEHLEGLLPPDQPQLTVVITIHDGDKALARLNAPVPALAAWRLYHDAIASMLRPTAIITLPEKLSEEEAEAIQARWMEKVKR